MVAISVKRREFPLPSGWTQQVQNLAGFTQFKSHLLASSSGGLIEWKPLAAPGFTLERDRL